MRPRVDQGWGVMWGVGTIRGAGGVGGGVGGVRACGGGPMLSGLEVEREVGSWCAAGLEPSGNGEKRGGGFCPNLRKHLFF